MAYVVCKHPMIQMDLMVKKKYWPNLVSYMERCECTYESEKEYDPGNGETYVCIKDVQSIRGYGLGELIGLFYGMEWASVTGVRPEVDKFYICLNPRKRGKKDHDGENRAEADPGRKGGDSGESSGSAEHGQAAGSGGDGARVVSVNADDLRGLEVLEADDDCD